MQKSRLIVAIVAGGVMACSDQAAAAPKAQPLEQKWTTIDPGHDWSGFYVGGNIGFSWGNVRTTGNETLTQNVSVFSFPGPILVSSVDSTSATAALTHSTVTGLVGGAQAGYNWQSGKWLVGLEADFQGSDERATGRLCTVAGCPVGSTVIPVNYKLDWFSTARGRVGFIAAERILLYATGGLAYGQFVSDVPSFPLGWRSTRIGWAVGAGAEAALDRHWSVRLEYLYVDLGNVGANSASSTTVSTSTNSLGLATAARIAPPSGIAPPPDIAPPAIFNTVRTTNIASIFESRFSDRIVRAGITYRFGGPIVTKY